MFIVLVKSVNKYKIHEVAGGPTLPERPTFVHRTKVPFMPLAVSFKIPTVIVNGRSIKYH